MNPTPIHLSALFIMLVFGIAFFLFISVYVCSKKGNLPPNEIAQYVFKALFLIFGWLFFTMILSFTGFLQNFDSTPPRLLFITLPPVIAIIALLISKKFTSLADHLNHFWLIYAQSFRIIIELILWMLHRYGVLPHQMSFESRNFDLITGLTAPFVAYYCFRKKTWPVKIALIWNLAGLALLINIVVVSLLSTPYSFAVFKEEPLNRIIFSFPFVWLPSFVVPFALFLHLLSLQRLMKKQPEMLAVG